MATESKENETVDPGKMGASFNRRAVVLQFNRESGEFITIIQLTNPKQREYLNKDFFSYVDVVMDPEKECIVGTFSEYSIQPIALQPLTISEAEMDLTARSKIERRYPLQTQIQIVAKSLLIALGDKAPEDLVEMTSFVDQVLTDNETRKTAFAKRSDVNYRTRSDDEQLLQRRMAGGVHELHGPRRVV